MDDGDGDVGLLEVGEVYRGGRDGAGCILDHSEIIAGQWDSSKKERVRSDDTYWVFCPRLQRTNRGIQPCVGF